MNAVPLLTRALQDPDLAVRSHARDALNQITEIGAVP